MEKKTISLAIASIMGIIPTIAHSAAQEAALYIQVRSSKLRAKPEFWSAPVADLSYGTVVTPLGAAPNDKSWLKAKLGSTEGYVHVSAVTKRKIILNPNASNSGKGVDQGSIVLAGKGFNKQVESNFGSSKGLNFTSVDEVEKLSVDPVEEESFVRDGKLIG